ncbi:hypothetical protein [Microbacterium esteraromaticum]|uniref:hypothetical protein n=1 Tax=Microbacterium esteraromaticum TaxID=57043 RepID=UPI0019D3D8C9|nr:hypothetical protein [Microbacterium esteraromaticum]MBN7792410.1 hypothetical protein [Microbacterium esteraromaticum]
MRILTIRQPWAWVIIHGGKDVENRVRNIAGDYRGPVAIHVAQADAETAPDELWLMHADWYRARGRQPKTFDPTFADRGRIIGVVDLVDVHAVGNPHFHPICHEPGKFGEAAGRGDGACSTWAHPHGKWHLVLANPRALSEPIPYKGALGLRRLDGDTTARIEAAIA